MAQDNPVSRRTALKITGAAASTALVAGCSGGNGDGNGNGNGNGEDSGAVAIEPGETIMFKATTNNTWEGKSPSGIEGQENPTIELTEGKSYTIGWDENAGSAKHNIALYSEGSPYEGNKTEQTAEPGDSQTIEFTASTNIDEYACVPHYGSGMKGTIKITEGSSGSGSGSGNESNSSNSSSE
ncbi:plastocyanin/azurin family copper-binding protein [Natrinema sp. DC36]|uniref:plastocyanin/azurin family copper-binding protein n=1 Tax=Natrinema sp. DC36 TaxID=2878680 RepID=UPI001CF040C7|nr:plastocyanin/azurin family copper-binding protein [Natrinema sp. DC36]